MNVNDTTSSTRCGINDVRNSPHANNTMATQSQSLRSGSLWYEDRYREEDNYINRRGIDNVQSLTGSAQAVMNSMDRLDDKSLYNNYRAKSSDSSYVQVRSSSDPNVKKSYTVEVDKLATGQTNKGQRLDEDNVYAGTTGRQTFQIEADGQRHDFTIDVEAGDTNEQVLRKMANAVNSGDIGINAWVSNGRNDTSSLVFQSEEAGGLAKNKFTVRDISGGSLAANTGISRTTQAAQDAVYTVNNRQYTSHSNDVSLGNGVDVTLKQETRRPVEISVKNDNRDAIEQVYKFVDAYNDLLSDSQTKTNGDTWLNRYLNVYSSSYSSAFKRAGIIRNSDGSLSIDKKALNKAAESGELEKVFTRDGIGSYGIANRIQQIAKNVQRNPSSFIDNSAKNSHYGTQVSFITTQHNHGYGFNGNNRPYVVYGFSNYSLFNLLT